MSADAVRCQWCGLRPAPSPTGACPECATARVDAWREERARSEVKHKGESTAARRARISAMGEADYRRAREEGLIDVEDEE